MVTNSERARTDADLLQRIARDDRQAFEELYERFSRPLYATALRILNDSAEAQDIVQDTFLALWEKAATYESARGSAFAWAVTLTRNRAIDRIRMRSRRAELLSAATDEEAGLKPTATGPDSAAKLLSKEHATVLRAAVASLPAEQKQAVDLAFFGGLTQQEIATRLSEPLGTVKARIRRGLLKLRDSLGGHHD
jgi:RNA polymerase sigma-70 factor (ECF subfamily)